MLTEDRHRFILRKLDEEGSIDIHQIMTETAASESTVRRDLSLLEKEKKLKRVFGGAVLPEEAPVIEERKEPAQDFFAQAALQLIPDGSRLFLDGHSPVEGLIPLLQQKNVIVVTDNIFYASELGRSKISVFIPGGGVGGNGIISGHETAAYISLFDFDLSIVAVDGLTARGALGANHPERANLVRLVAARSRKVIVLLSAKTAKQKAFMEIQTIERAHLITDLDDESIETRILPTHPVNRI